MGRKKHQTRPTEPPREKASAHRAGLPKTVETPGGLGGKRNQNFPSHNCTVSHDVDLVKLFIPGNSILRRFTRCWRRLCLIDESSPLARQVLHSDMAVKREISRHLTYYPCTVHPLSRFRFAWECLMIVTFAMAFQMIPYDVVFMFRVEDYYPFTAFHWILLATDIICLLDVVMSCYTGTYDRRNRRVELNPATIRSRYLCGWFWIDTISSAPDPIITILIPPATLDRSLLFCLHKLEFHPGCAWDLWSLVSVIKIFRFRTFLRYIRRFGERLRLRRNIIKFTTILVTVLTVFHWGTCIMFLVIRLVQGTDPAMVDERSWTQKVPFWNQSSFIRYLECSYRILYTVTHITHDFSESMTYDDMLLSLLFTICGYLLKVYLLAELLIFIRMLFSSTSKYHEYRYELNNYMRHEQLPAVLHKQILEFYDIRHPNIYSRWSLIRSTIGEQLFRQVRMEIVGPLLNACPLFAELLSEQQMIALACVMDFQIFMKNDIITRCDGGGRESAVGEWKMIFIVSGTVAIFTRGWKMALQLEDGEHFGEFQLLLDESCVKFPNLVAVETSELYLLTQAEFDLFMQPYPSLRENLRYRARTLLQEMEQMRLSDAVQMLETVETIRMPPRSRVF
ncbi:potassium/sodium hyperpolarization-activated cyclic nucleotide-gated channel 1-like [Anopheles bellator]|uniref:potassium/sodium hyperpolarization-activated cyclic nucleotide-gated channel 1-like n=1 Tax=Anopheles bellator TaxID=139047 RepID=UPI002649BD86|nr:potassium/sodium hyperpolarization-activated cyclic nucleotide-gated channel 1-like [Anopheles bellator]